MLLTYTKKQNIFREKGDHSSKAVINEGRFSPRNHDNYRLSNKDLKRKHGVYLKIDLLR